MHVLFFTFTAQLATLSKQTHSSHALGSKLLRFSGTPVSWSAEGGDEGGWVLDLDSFPVVTSG